MLSTMRPRRVGVDRLVGGAVARDEDVDWATPIDRSRRFYPEGLTPLFHTRVYGELEGRHRLRYNQLTALYSNELIGFLETFVLRRTLDALLDRRDLPVMLAAALRRFRDEEVKHAAWWSRLNRLSDPDEYGESDWRILSLPPGARAAASFAASRPTMFPVVFWIQLAQEERSVAISRGFLRAAPGEIEPRYRAVYGSHLRDEVRHVQIDWHLVDHFFASRPVAVRRANAWLFRHLVRLLFLTPSRSTARIVDRLVREYPELRPLAGRMRAELQALGESETYQAMMYSRETTPITFALFDRFPEFHSMRRCLSAYRPQPAGSAR